MTVDYERDRLILLERLGERLRQVEHHGEDAMTLTLPEAKAVLTCLTAQTFVVVRSGPKERPASLSRAALKVLKILSDRGEFYDNDGRAVSLLKKLTGHRTTNALSNLLHQVEADGLIERWIAGRRTYSIRITPAGKQAVQIDEKVSRGCRTEGMTPSAMSWRSGS